MHTLKPEILRSYDTSAMPVQPHCNSAIALVQYSATIALVQCSGDAKCVGMLSMLVTIMSAVDNARLLQTVVKIL